MRHRFVESCLSHLACLPVMTRYCASRIFHRIISDKAAMVHEANAYNVSSIHGITQEQLLSWTVYEACLQLDFNRRQYHIVYNTRKKLATAEENNTFWYDILSPVEMDGAIDFLMAHKEPVQRCWSPSTMDIH